MYEFVNVVTVSALFEAVNEYPSGILPSVHVYVIFSPASYTGKLSIVADHPFCAFSVTVFPSLNVTVKLAGLFPSWLLASFHTFFTVKLVVSGVCLFVIVVTVPFVVLLFNEYPSGILPSVHVYVIFSPALYTGKLSIVADHPFCAFNVTVFPSLNVIVKLSGLFPSWFSASSHTFVTVRLVVSGV